MRKIFLTAVLALILSVPNFCGAVNVSREQSTFHDMIFYPQVHMNDAALEKKINTAIIAEIDRFVTGVYNNAQANNFEVADIRADYEIACNEAGGTVILSIIFTESNYFAGGAHPATIKRALNINTASGELMSMDYLLEVGEGVSPDHFRKKIETALRRYCAREGIMLFNDALPLKQLPQEFYWDKNLHVHFIFNHYEVAPYAAGIIDVDIDA